MKHILFPTDLSLHAENALNYALNLASAGGVKMTVYHALQPEMVGGFEGLPPLIQPASAEDKIDLLGNLKNYVHRICEDLGVEVDLDFELNEGEPIRQIPELAQSIGADLIVMGTHGAGNLVDKMMGSVSAEVLQRSPIPVMVIPPQAGFKPIRQVVFANDLQGRNLKLLYNLANFARKLGGKVKAVFLAQDEIQDEKAELLEDMHRASMEFSSIDLDVIATKGQSSSAALENYLKAQQADMLVVVPHQRSFFEALFHRSFSRKMALRAQIPVLAWPDPH